MATRTWAEIFSLVLKDSGVLGVGQSALPEDINDTRMRCQMMLDQWKSNRWIVYHLLDIACACDGSLFYEVGPGEVLDTIRPDRLEAAFMRQTVQSQPSRIDYPLTLISAMEDYSTIALKQLQAAPSRFLFYDSGFPTGKAYPYPLAPNGWELHILVKATLDTVGDDMQATINLPPEYYAAIYWNLVSWTREAYTMPPRPKTEAMAIGSLSTIKASNFQIRTLKMPGAVQPWSSNRYNVLSDQGG